MSRAHQARRPRDDRGATAVEYALMVSLIALTIIGGVTAFGFGVKGLFDPAAAFFAGL